MYNTSLARINPVEVVEGEGYNGGHGWNFGVEGKSSRKALM